MIPFGVSLNVARTSSVILVSSITPVPNVFTSTETGSATPIAYASCTSQRVASPAAVTAHAAVGIDNDLAPRQPRVAVRTAHHETPCGINVELSSGIHHPRRQDRIDHVLSHLGAQRLGRDFVGMLRRDHHRVKP